MNAAVVARVEGPRARSAETTIVARSPQMRDILALARRAAASDLAVLVTGESGTGKDLVARAIHATGARAARPFVPINCAALPDALVESELFGYRRGAFTGAHGDKPGLVAVADGGTLFLDEVAELPGAVQAKLLRVLEDGTYWPVGALGPRAADVRVVAATNADLGARVEAGTFRRDLYYRLAAFPIHLPPLRERPEDLVAIARRLVAERVAADGRLALVLSDEALEYLVGQPWPGNVRQLQHAVERALLVAAGDVLVADDFRVPIPDAGCPTAADLPARLPADGLDLPGLVRALVAAALEREGGNVSAAARLLGLTRPALRYRLKKYGLAPCRRRG